MPELFISAGDPSGDTAASMAVTELLKLEPQNLTFFGLGGHKLRLLGQEQFANPDDLAVLGFWEVAKRYYYFRRLFHVCVAEIKRRKPNAIVLVDYPGFNLRLAARVSELGIPVIYYIAPQVWAWGKWRIPALKKHVTKLLVILPFEQEFFARHGIDSTFVGHYLLDDIPVSLQASPPSDESRLALLPGSRVQEIQAMLPIMLKTANGLYRKSGVISKIAALEGRFDYESEVRKSGAEGVDVHYNSARNVLADSRYALVASGTATLETGIIGRPMVILYKTSQITYWLARRLVRLDSIGLVNLVLGSKVAPELIQDEANPENILAALTRLSELNEYGRVREQLLLTSGLLGGRGSSKRAAGVIAHYL